ncbi:hypothetical protein Poly41_06840 [Novipirellula artificiosorum]|uniref:Uncharacterized protein n=1 Tax=Novipirellula artificiosorum TaxID=2528016 RepID=A0A5C6E350_9BACT|nr:hypothetical protein Poly41_06840 [Novipirellula artificiosorum]
MDHLGETLSNLRITAQGVAKLQKALPECKIEWHGEATDEPAQKEWHDLGCRLIRLPKGMTITEIAEEYGETWQTTLVRPQRTSLILTSDGRYCWECHGGSLK